MKRRKGNKKMVAPARIFNFCDHLNKKFLEDKDKRNKPIKFSEMSDAARKQSMRARKNDD